MKVTDRHIVIAPPAFFVEVLLKALVDFLKSFGYQVHLVSYEKNWSMEDCYESVCKKVEEVEQTIFGYPNAHFSNMNHHMVYLIGISKGAPLVHRLAQCTPGRFSGVMLYSSPWMGGWPIWSTLFTIFLTSSYFWPIFRKKGQIRLKEKDVRSLLYGGQDGGEIENLTKIVSESGLIYYELLKGSMLPNIYPELRYAIISASKEKFHRNSAKKRFSKRCVNACYCELEGSHFGLLDDRLFLEFVAGEVSCAFSGKGRIKDGNTSSDPRIPDADESDVDGDALVVNRKFSGFVRVP